MIKPRSRHLVAAVACVSALAAVGASGACAAPTAPAASLASTSTGRAMTVNISNQSSRTLVLTDMSTAGSWKERPAAALRPGDHTYATAIDDLFSFDLIIIYSLERPVKGHPPYALNFFAGGSITTAVTDKQELAIKSAKRRTKQETICDIELTDAE